MYTLVNIHRSTWEFCGFWVQSRGAGVESKGGVNIDIHRGEGLNVFNTYLIINFQFHSYYDNIFKQLA